MRLISYRHNTVPSVGIMLDDKYFVDLSKAAPKLPKTLKALLDMERGLDLAAAAIEGRDADLNIEDVILDPVIPDPCAIWALALNYQSHLDETGLTTSPDYPHVFLRHKAGQVGSEQPLLCPNQEIARAYDYEGELAIVIGKGGRNIPLDKAFDHVAGYSIYNEASVREFQGHNRQFGLGKNFERSGAFGPWLMTADEFNNPDDHTITTRLNGIIRQQESCSGVLFKVNQLLCYISIGYQLRPGDVIVSGTPGAVKPAEEDKEAQIAAHFDETVKYKGRVHMKPGDICEVEISGLGILTNQVVADKGDYQIF